MIEQTEHEKIHDMVRLHNRSFIVIRQNSTGEIRVANWNLPWYEHSMFFWTDGNFGCDCNRHDLFERVDDPKYDTDDEVLTKCGHTRYTVIKAIFPDGTEAEIDGH